jgi:hypothetical protein
MALVIRLLGAGSINTASTRVLYPDTVNFPVPAGVLGAIVNNVRIVNLAGSSVSVNLYYRPNGGAIPFRILDRNKAIAAGDVLVVKPELTLAAGDQIEIVTTGSPQLEYVVSGVEKK